MRGVYSHVTPGMRADLTAWLHELWEASLRDRARIATQSLVGVLDPLLESWQEPTNKIGSPVKPGSVKPGSQLLPESDTGKPEGPAAVAGRASDLRFQRGGRGDLNPRPPGPQPGALTN
jgi:hypothetical protein